VNSIRAGLVRSDPSSGTVPSPGGAGTLVALVATDPQQCLAAGPAVRVVTDDGGSRIQVDGRDFMVFGMNWDYMPSGRTTSTACGPSPTT